MRLDYNINTAHRLTARVMLDHYTLTDPYGTFIGGNLPTVPDGPQPPRLEPPAQPQLDDLEHAAQRGQVQLLGQQPVDRPRRRQVEALHLRLPVPADLPGGGTYEDSIPVGAISGFAGWQSASNALISPTKDFAFADTLTILKGAHTLKTGVLGIYNTKKQNGRSHVRRQRELQPLRQPEQHRQRLRGRAPRQLPHLQRGAARPDRALPLLAVEAFVTDGWRVTPNFSVELGVRYTYHYPTITAGNNLTAFDPGTLRSGAGGHGQHERHARARHRQPLQRPGPPRRGARQTRRPTCRTRTAPPCSRSRSPTAAASTTRSTSSCRASASRGRPAATVRRPSAAGSASTTTGPRATCTSACRTTRRSPSARPTRTATSPTPAAPRCPRSRRGAACSRSRRASRSRASGTGA